MDKSLEVLNPKPWASRKYTYTSETAKTLESLSRQIMEAATARDWQNTLFTKYVAPKFIADFEHSAGQVLDSWQAYIEHHERIASQNPYHGFEVLNTAADVYELSGKAIIYVLLKGFGHPKNVQRESIMLMYWRRREGLWRCHKEKVIRGLHWLPECQVEMVAENAPADFDDDEDQDDEDVADGEKQQTTGA